MASRQKSTRIWAVVRRGDRIMRRVVFLNTTLALLQRQEDLSDWSVEWWAGAKGSEQKLPAVEFVEKFRGRDNETN